MVYEPAGVPREEGRRPRRGSSPMGIQELTSGGDTAEGPPGSIVGGRRAMEQAPEGERRTKRRKTFFAEEVVKVLAHGPPSRGAATRDECVTWRGAQQPNEGVGPRRSGQRETGDLAIGAAKCKPVSDMGGPGPDGGATPPGPNHSPCADKWATISRGAGPGGRSFMAKTIG